MEKNIETKFGKNALLCAVFNFKISILSSIPDNGHDKIWGHFAGTTSNSTFISVLRPKKLGRNQCTGRFLTNFIKGNRVVKFADIFAHQISGIAMGMSPAPTIANLFVAIHEKAEIYFKCK